MGSLIGKAGGSLVLQLINAPWARQDEWPIQVKMGARVCDLRGLFRWTGVSPKAN